MAAWVKSLVDELAAIELPHVFNPYRQKCVVHDQECAPTIRRANLVSILKAYSKRPPPSIVFGRDFGYRGARRTGLSLTDEAHLENMQRALGASPLKRATVGPAVAERTAAVVWNVMERLSDKPLLWNAFPLHPHEPNREMSNRAHNAAERRLTAWTIHVLVQQLKPSRLIAVGNDAAAALSDLGLSFDCVRHPSYGGQRAFIEGMERLHGLPVTGRLHVDTPTLEFS